MKLPDKVCVGPGQWFPVEEKTLDGPLGYFDPKTETIYIEKDQPAAGKFNILLHELIHVADTKNKQGGAYKTGLSEKQVTFMAGCLFPILVYSGLFKGVTPKMMKEYEDIFEV